MKVRSAASRWLVDEVLLCTNAATFNQLLA
jgi:hypothetical protein